MFSTALIFVATVLVYSHNIHSLEVDIESFFKNIHLEKQKIPRVESKKSSNYELIKLIQKIIQGSNAKDKYFPNEIWRNQYVNKDLNNLQLKEIPNIRPNWLKSHPKQTALNDQLNDGQKFYEDIRKDRNDYSKVYLVLDPESNLSSSDVREINSLVASVFSKYFSNKKATNRDHDKEIRRYKGFVIKDNRRRFKESLEKFAPKDSVGSDYKPKKGRGDYGRGGGRTSIPYIRHRGDIYEKD